MIELRYSIPPNLINYYENADKREEETNRRRNKTDLLGFFFWLILGGIFSWLSFSDE